MLQSIKPPEAFRWPPEVKQLVLLLQVADLGVEKLMFLLENGSYYPGRRGNFYKRLPKLLARALMYGGYLRTDEISIEDEEQACEASLLGLQDCPPVEPAAEPTGEPAAEPTGEPGADQLLLLPASEILSFFEGGDEESARVAQRREQEDEEEDDDTFEDTYQDIECATSEAGDLEEEEPSFALMNEDASPSGSSQKAAKKTSAKKGEKKTVSPLLWPASHKKQLLELAEGHLEASEACINALQDLARRHAPHKLLSRATTY